MEFMFSETMFDAFASFEVRSYEINDKTDQKTAIFLSSYFDIWGCLSKPIYLNHQKKPYLRINYVGVHKHPF